MTHPVGTYQLQLRQRLTMMQNRYDLVRPGPGGEEVLGYAEQKRFSLKEKITFWTGKGSGEVLFTVTARNVFELVATYDVVAADGTPLAILQKDAKSSLLRSTYNVELPSGRRLVVQERSPVQAVARRAVGLLTDFPWLFPIHFDAVDQSGHVALSVERVMRVRDSYNVTVDQDLDPRVAGAVAVAVDAFMNR